jgi:hypothetical protein
MSRASTPRTIRANDSLDPRGTQAPLRQVALSESNKAEQRIVITEAFGRPKRRAKALASVIRLAQVRRFASIDPTRRISCPAPSFERQRGALSFWSWRRQPKGGKQSCPRTSQARGAWRKGDPCNRPSALQPSMPQRRLSCRLRNGSRFNDDARRRKRPSTAIQQRSANKAPVIQ